MRFTLLLGLLLVSPAATQTDAPSGPPLGLEGWPTNELDARVARERALVQAIDPASLARWHELVASQPHAAGSKGDAAVIASLRAAFESMGLEVTVHPFRTYLSRPVDATLEIVTPNSEELPLREGVLPGSPFSEFAGDEKLKDLDRLGWNAYSGSGDVTAEVVYANYGRREDFLQLAEMGIDCTGKIVLARYGGNFRGYKAKYAEEHGAAGLVIFTDPKDSGYGRGVETPEGGWANCNQIQRGSLKTLPWSGDPLTPNVEATPDAKRLDPSEVTLPTIPVQPIGWLAATRIMAQMQGASVPGDWQGGLPFRYRLAGGPDLKVRLMVQQQREFVDTANVLATLRGSESEQGDLGMIVGSHHDAWIYGAHDPTSGLIAVLECARVLTEASRQADSPPRKSITFAAWGAEEHGIIGSTEWVEGNRQRIIDRATLYVNLDAAASGLKLGVSASPSLTSLLGGAASVVPQPAAPEGTSALDAWRGGTEGAPPIGFLGGGSDHVSFLALCSLPSASVSARGAPGTAYHSLYDDLAWYRRVVGSDYASATLVARIVTTAIDRAANAPVTPIDLAAPARALGLAVQDLAATHPGLLPSEATEAMVRRAVEQSVDAARIETALHAATRERRLSVSQRKDIEGFLRRLERAWLHEQGLPGRPWYRNLYTAPDETSGYAAWPLPGLQKAALEADEALALEQITHLQSVLDRRAAALLALGDALTTEGQDGND